MRVPSLFLTAALAAALPAQGSVTVNDVGLTMDGGILTVIYGQSCGPFTCAPFHAGAVAAGQPPRTVVVYGAPAQIYVLAIDLANQAPCIAIPGIRNALILGPQPITLAIGLVGPGSAITPCQQGRAPYLLSFPAGAPSGVQFQLQALAMSPSQNVPAFTIALQAMIQ
jgi:hypothetical protein